MFTLVIKGFAVCLVLFRFLGEKTKQTKETKEGKRKNVKQLEEKHLKKTKTQAVSKLLPELLQKVGCVEIWSLTIKL